MTQRHVTATAGGDGRWAIRLMSLAILPTVQGEREMQFEKVPNAAAHKFAVGCYDLAWRFLLLGP